MNKLFAIGVCLFLAAIYAEANPLIEKTNADPTLASFFESMDSDKDGYVTKEEAMAQMKTMVGPVVPEEKMESFERQFNEGDSDHDGKISLKDLVKISQALTSAKNSMPIDVGSCIGDNQPCTRDNQCCSGHCSHFGTQCSFFYTCCERQ